MTDLDLPALMAVRVQGVATPDRFALALGLAPGAADSRAEALVADGLATRGRVGPVEGLLITQDGERAIGEAIGREGLRSDRALRDAFERFESLDGRLKRVVSDWQIRRHGTAEVPNDHADAEYDQAVIDRLGELHDAALVVLRRLEGRAARYGPYGRRLGAAVDRLYGGDRTAFARPGAESYHQIWWELHEDLLVTLGILRAE